MSEINYLALRERYSPKPAPRCSVCGEEMSIQRISGAHVVYACSGEGVDWPHESPDNQYHLNK